MSLLTKIQQKILENEESNQQVSNTKKGDFFKKIRMKNSQFLLGTDFCNFGRFYGGHIIHFSYNTIKFHHINHPICIE